ncbi:zf-C3HC-domain-containing protein [Xylariaceae sp. FL0594]|nr:zf-C3HC-domain-containing protein [Xylariaceae sp. FL0594]
MNATKRKFNTLLQGIGARSPQTNDRTSLDDEFLGYSSPLGLMSTTSISTPNAKASAPGIARPDSPSPATDLLSKRRRTGLVETTTSPNQKIGPTTVSNVTLSKWTPQSKTQKTEPPRYCPSDRDELIRRLGTFQELTEWTPKPDKVNEIEWAKRGWVCQGKERVRCTLCSRELVVKTNTTTVDGKEVPVVVGSDVEQGLSKRFAELIIDGHDEDCLWRRHGCDDTLLRLPLAVPQTALKSLRERYDDLCSRPSFLPYLFNLRLPPTLDLKAVKSQLPPTFFTDPAPPDTTTTTTTSTPTKPTSSSGPNDVALALALTGWQGLTNPRIGAVPNTATCATCLRRLGLWMFKSREVDEVTSEILAPAPMDHLDPVREHRFFCPWRNAATQRNPGAARTTTTATTTTTTTKTNDSSSSSSSGQPKAGWEVLAQTLKNSAFLRVQGERSASKQQQQSGGGGRFYRARHHRPAASLPGTPSKLITGEGEGEGEEEEGEEEEEEEDMAAREAKDKERWAKLRRVKSLFDSKSRRKMQQQQQQGKILVGTSNGGGYGNSSRPGTATSQRQQQHQQQQQLRRPQTANSTTTTTARMITTRGEGGEKEG